jgi:hypothetical protein
MREFSYASANSAQLERWLGAARVEQLSQSMRGWYGPPILVGNMPREGGAIFVCGDGDFIGRVGGGEFGSWHDRAWDMLKRVQKSLARASRRTAHSSPQHAYSGFASFSDFLAELSVKQQIIGPISKIGVTGILGISFTLWYETGQPPTGATAAALAAGTNHTKATTGALQFTNAQSGDTLHVIGAELACSAQGNTLLLYDRIWAGEPAINTTGAQTITMTPARYASLTNTAQDYCGGNFAFVEVRVVLPATAHTWTLQYSDQAGNAAENAAAITGVSSAAAKRLDHTTVGQFFIPLNTGDSGISDLTQITLSATLASGSPCLVLAHPLEFFPLAMPAWTFHKFDSVNGGPPWIPRVFDDACLALEISKPSTTAATYSGVFKANAG